MLNFHHDIYFTKQSVLRPIFLLVCSCPRSHFFFVSPCVAYSSTLKWRQQVLMKLWYLPPKLYSITSQISQLPYIDKIVVCSIQYNIQLFSCFTFYMPDYKYCSVRSNVEAKGSANTHLPQLH
jgi:hypothetical protein